MSNPEIDAIRALLTSKARPVGWTARRERLDEIGSVWPVAEDITLTRADLGGVEAVGVADSGALTLSLNFGASAWHFRQFALSNTPRYLIGLRRRSRLSELSSPGRRASAVTR